MTPADASLLALVRRCWSDVLEMPVAADDAWADLGGDSLKSLRMMHALETALGRKLSFELIGPEMTAAGLARALEREADRLDTHAPVVFLITGIFGDSPGLADFRRWFGDRLRFEVMDLPEVDAPAAVLGDLANTARVLAREIERRAPVGNIVLAGFSFGGLAAFEVDRQLTIAGRRVARLVILDSFWPSTLHAAEDRRPAPHPGRFITGRYWRSMQPARDVMLGVGSFDALRRGMLAVTRRFRPHLYAAVREHFQRHFRVPAMDRWEARPTRTPTLFIVSGNYAPVTPAKWGALCEDLQVVQVAGGHSDLFKLDRLAVYGPVFEAAVRAAARG